MATRKSTKRALSTSPFRFKILIDNGSGGRKVARELSYPKPPARWSAIDLLTIVRTMAHTAAEVRRQKITDKRLTVWCDTRDGGTEITVSHTGGAWAYLPGRSLIRIPSPAIAGLLGVSEWGGTAHMTLPAMLPLDLQAFRKQQERSLRLFERVRRTIEAEMKAVGQ